MTKHAHNHWNSYQQKTDLTSESLSLNDEGYTAIKWNKEYLNIVLRTSLQALWLDK